MADDERGKLERPPAGLTRRHAKSREGWRLALKASEYARDRDEAGFAEMLHRLEVWEGDPAFEEGMAIFREVCRELERQGR